MYIKGQIEANKSNISYRNQLLEKYNSTYIFQNDVYRICKLNENKLKQGPIYENVYEDRTFVLDVYRP